MRTRTILALLMGVCPCTFAQAPPVVHYELKMQDLKYVYGPATPVARVPRGAIIETNTVDADGKAVEAKGLKVPGFNPLTGPFYIEGAAPGDTLVVHFLSVQVDGDKGYGDIGGALNSNHYTPMIGKGLKAESWVYPIDHARNIATFQAKDSKF